MAAPMKFNVFVGSETGLLKSVNTASNKWENANKVESVSKEYEIRSLCSETLRDRSLLVGTRHHKIFAYDTKTSTYSHRADLSGCDGYLKTIRTLNDNLVTASDNGIVRIWSQEYKKLNEYTCGSHLTCMIQNPESVQTIATGGKENDLKIWNLNDTEKPIFQAKNVKNDWLNLRVPIWVTGAEFIPQSDKIVTCTGHHQIRVYDPKAQRRPVLDMTFDEHPITAISLCPQSENHAMIGTARGKLATIDFRKGSTVNIYKGFAGSIRDIKCLTSKPYVASCGLDRFLRIHDYKTKELKHRYYLKSRLNCLFLFDNDAEVSEDMSQECEGEEEYINSEEDEDEEEIWSKMEQVTAKPRIKHKLMLEEKQTPTKIRKKNQKKSTIEN